MSLDDNLRTIQTRISQVQGKRARAQVEQENALSKLTTAKATLKEEFGVVSNEDAKAKLAELEATLVETVSAVELELEAAGA